MSKGFLGLVTTLLAGASLALAQPAPPPPSARPSAPPTEPASDLPSLEPQPGHHPGGPSPCPEAACCWEVPACAGPRFWIGAEYLLWWVKEGPLPTPLVTTSPLGSAGILGMPGTTVLFGGDGIDYDTFSGLRGTIGRRLGSSGIYAAELSGFFLEEGTTSFARISDTAGNPLLARPILNAVTVEQTSVLVAAPGSFAGGIRVASTSQLWGAEANLLASLLAQGETGLSVLAGFRYLELDEDLDILSRSNVLPGGVSAFEGMTVLSPDSLAIRDTFGTRNRFYGGQVGLRGSVRRGRLLVDVTGKVAFGDINQVIKIGGRTTLVTPEGIAGIAPGGVLALPSNMGRHGDADFAYIPEAILRASMQITPRLSAHVGYTILYWDNVVRPGDQINRAISLTQVPSSLQFGTGTGDLRLEPRRPRNDSHFWAQGLSLGLAFRY